MKNFNWYKDWKFFNLFNIISIYWKRREVLKSIKGIFISPKCYFVFTKDYAPFIFCSHYGKLLSIVIQDLEWKDKWKTPRHEENPFISIGLFNKFFFNWEWKFPKNVEERWIDNDDYWEQVLWWLYYCDKNISKARNTWPWRNENDESTWNDKFVIK